MNILEAYIKKFKQIIILILGLPCTSKSDIAKELTDDLNIPIINISDYLITDKFVNEKIDGVSFKIYEHPDNYDWEKLNEDVNKKRETGVIIYGNYLIKDKINWEIDFSFFYNMNTTLCTKILIEKKILPYENQNDKLKIYFDKIFNPLYESIKTDIKINKFFNIKEDTTFENIYEKTFDILMELIKLKLK